MNVTTRVKNKKAKLYVTIVLVLLSLEKISEIKKIINTLSAEFSNIHQDFGNFPKKYLCNFATLKIYPLNTIHALFYKQH